MDFYRRKGKGVDLRAGLRKLARNRRLMLALVIGAPIVVYAFLGPRG